uniref:Uncharacterized protein n=1 Tax=Romanomermis culicivorax TaxID=13658 RepID=A0A915JAB9_ROMCU
MRKSCFGSKKRFVFVVRRCKEGRRRIVLLYYCSSYVFIVCRSHGPLEAERIDSKPQPTRNCGPQNLPPQNLPPQKTGQLVHDFVLDLANQLPVDLQRDLPFSPPLASRFILPFSPPVANCLAQKLPHHYMMEIGPGQKNASQLKNTKTSLSQTTNAEAVKIHEGFNICECDVVEPNNVTAKRHSVPLGLRA